MKISERKRGQNREVINFSTEYDFILNKTIIFAFVIINSVQRYGKSGLHIQGKFL